MKKIYLMLASALIGTGSLMAQATWNTQHYGTMQTDTVYHVTVGPGTTETRAKLHFSTTGVAGDPFDASATVNYLEIDLTNPYVTMKVARAGKTIDYVKKSVKNMMAENTTYQKHYFAGVNGDFFGDVPCGFCVTNGAFANGPAGMSNGKNPNQLIIDKNGLPTIATSIEVSGGIDPGWMVHTDKTLGHVTYPDGYSEQSIRFNTHTRWEGYLVAYTDVFMKLDYDKVHTEVDENGSTIKDENGNNKQFPNQTGYTSQNHWGVEAQLTPYGESKHVLGEPVEYIVGKVTQSGRGGNMKIPAGGLVLSGNNCGDDKHPFNAAKGKLDQLKSGDKVTLNFPFKADGVDMTCRETVGGYPRLVVEGEAISAAPSGAPGDLALAKRRARTAVGYNQDKTKMYIFVVQDNVVPASVSPSKTREDGMTVKALANFMQAVGCYEALNFDGGGSSVMHVENLGQRSDVQASWTYQRPVINGLFAVTEAPEDREVARIEFVDKTLSIKPGRGYQPVIYAYNQYGVLISTGLQNYTLSADEATFDASKRKMIAPAEGYFALSATYNGITASIPVKVDAEGIDGSDPATEPSFSGNEFTAIPEKPADWVDPNQPNLYIAGKAANNWDFFNPVVVYPVTGKNNIYEFDIDSSESATIEGVNFKMTTLDPRTNGGSAAFKAEGCAWHTNELGATNPNVLGNGKTLTLLPGNADNITTPWVGKWHFVVDLNEKTITATTTTPRPEVETPEHVYLVGSIDGETDGRVEMTGANGLYRAANINLTGTDAAQFAFVADNTPYGAYINGATFKAEDDFYAGSNSWSIEPGAYDITFSTNTCKVTVTPHIFAELEDVTPAGYDFDKYEAGTIWKFAELPATTTSGTWTAPGGIYKQENMDADGHVTALHIPGKALDVQDENNLLTDSRNAFSVQKHPSELVGNCLVYTQNYSPGHHRCDWPNTNVNLSRNLQLSFYADPTKIDGSDVNHPIRFRMVFQVLYRGRHAQPGTNEVTNVYASASNANANVWATSYNGVGDNEVGPNFPVHHSAFYKWENEGTTIAEIPEAKILVDGGEGPNEPWDVNSQTKEPLEQGAYATRYLINSERFVVYEYDFYGKPDNGTLGVHVNFGGGSYATYVFKEIKFFNVLNGEELLGKENAAKAPARVANAEKPFVTNTAAGSLLGTRSISYRYYTPEGVKEFAAEYDNSGIDNVVVDTEDSNAPVEYYNLQGIRVENPANGIYIKRQGSKATKVLIK